MSEDKLIRLKNLKRVIGDRGLTVSDLERDVGGRSTYWRDLLKGNKSFGEKAARHIEEQLKLPRGWLDSNETTPATRHARGTTLAEAAGAYAAPSVTIEQRAVLEDLARLLPEDYERIRKEIAELAARIRRHDEEMFRQWGVSGTAPAHRVAHIPKPPASTPSNPSPPAPKKSRLPTPSTTGNVRSKPAHHTMKKGAA